MKLTRKELYDLVWAEPITTLAKRFGLSGAELGRRCTTSNIPLPPNGYWSKLKYGKSVEIIPLSDDHKAEIDLAPILTRQQEVELDISKGDTSVFEVPEVLYAKDALIIDTKEKHREDLIPWSQRKNPYKNKRKETLHVRVGEKSIDRALCIFSTVIKALRYRGHNIKIIKENEYRSYTYAVVAGESIRVDMSEKKKQDATSDNPRNSTNYIFSGELHFNIYGRWDRLAISYKDTAHTRLDDKIVSIIAYLEIYAQERIEERKAEEEYKIRKAEEDRIRKEKEAIEREIRQKFEVEQEAELNEFKMLFNMAERLRKANILRQYITDYEKHLKENEALNDEVEKKLDWARNKADWLDPFKDVDDKYLDEYNKDKILEPIKTESASNIRHSSTSTAQTERYNFWTRPYRWFNKRR